MAVPDKDVHGSVAAVARDPRLDACAAGLDDLRRRFDALERRTMADEMPGASRFDYDEDRELAFQNKSREEQREVTRSAQQRDREYAEQTARRLQSEGKYAEARKYWRMTR